MEKRVFHLTILAICAFALMLRIGLAVWWQDRLGDPERVLFGDSIGYLDLGAQIAEGNPYQFGWEHSRIFRAPGYPILLSPLSWLDQAGRPILSARILNACFGTLLVGLLAWLVCPFAGRRVACCAAILAAIYPGALMFSVLILAEGPFCLVMLVCLMGLAKWIEEINGGDSHRRLSRVSIDVVSSQSDRESIQAKGRDKFVKSLGLPALFGIACAVGTLIRPSWLLFLPLASGLVFVVTWRNLATNSIGFQSKRVIVCGICFGAMMAPWWIRNYEKVGAFVPTTLQAGASLFDGLHQDADGGSDMSAIYRLRMDFLEQTCQRLKLAPPSYSDRMLDQDGAPTEHYWIGIRRQIERIEKRDPNWTFELALDGYLRDHAVEWAANHPDKVAWLAGQKVIRLWTPVANESGLGSRAMRWGVAASYLGTLVLIVIGITRIGPTHVLCWVYSLPALYFTLLHLIFVSSIRYREPAMIAWLPLAAIGLAWITKSWMPRVLGPRDLSREDSSSR